MKEKDKNILGKIWTTIGGILTIASLVLTIIVTIKSCAYGDKYTYKVPAAESVVSIEMAKKILAQLSDELQMKVDLVQYPGDNHERYIEVMITGARKYELDYVRYRLRCAMLKIQIIAVEKP